MENSTAIPIFFLFLLLIFYQVPMHALEYKYWRWVRIYMADSQANNKMAPCSISCIKSNVNRNDNIYGNKRHVPGTYTASACLSLKGKFDVSEQQQQYGSSIVVSRIIWRRPNTNGFLRKIWHISFLKQIIRETFLFAFKTLQIVKA